MIKDPMINDPLTLDKAIEILNSIIEADPKAARELLAEYRVPCNRKLADHPTVQISGEYDDDKHLVSAKVGMLGVLNGLFGIFTEGPHAGWGALTAVFDVICPDCGVNEGPGVMGDPCAKCGKTLELGPLTRFRRTQEA